MQTPQTTQTYAMIGQQHLDGLAAALDKLTQERAEIAAYLRDLDRKIAQQEGAINFAAAMIDQAAQAAGSAPTPSATPEPAAPAAPDEEQPQ